jgi:hypothetical protein
MQGPGGTGGVAWGDTRTAGAGAALTHTIGPSAAAGVQSFKTVVDNPQSQALTIIDVDLGTSSFAHIAYRALIKNNLQKGFSASMGANLSTGANGLFVGIDSTQSAAIALAKIDMGGVGNLAHSGMEITVGGFGNSLVAASRVKITGASSNANAYVAENASGSSGVGFDYRSTHGTNFNGTGFKFSTASPRSNIGKIFDFVLNSDNETIGRTTEDIATIETRRTIPSGSLTDNFDTLSISREDKTTGGTLNASGAVVKIEGIATESAGTLNSSVVPLEVVQGAKSTGAPIKVTQAAVVSVKFKKIADYAGVTIWISTDGTAAEANLSGTVGDICLNGGTANGQAAYCDATGTNWTDM